MPRRSFALSPASAIIALFLVAACATFVKLHYIGVTTAGDYGGYVETAQYFSGQQVPNLLIERVLKPLNPLLVALLHLFVNYQSAFIIQAVLFYFAYTYVLY